jgi:hypothetical protein
VIKSRRIRGAGHVACMEERRGTYRILDERPKGYKPLGRPRPKRKNNIKMNFQ